MAEKTILVCDVCGKPATQAVSIRVGQRNLWKDLCDLHVTELTAGARPAKPGRRREVDMPVQFILLRVSSVGGSGRTPVPKT